VARASANGIEAWQRWLDDGRTVPRGLANFLRSAEVREGEDGTLTLAPLAGPAVERLADREVMNEIRTGLTPYLGRPPVVVLQRPDEGPDKPARVSPEEVREDTLKALFRQEPRLERAVEELDLELME
jgi:hypothetical protein